MSEPGTDIVIHEVNSRECKRCLIYEMAGSERIYETIQQYIDNLEDASRTDGQLVTDRLKCCKECDRLISGMCKACGCYVEIRAAVLSNKCPYDLW